MADPGLSLNDLRIRDPFILVAQQERAYYLYGSTDPNIWSGPGIGFDAYRSSDLDHWDGPFRVFEPPEGFWGQENFWAPEVFELDDRFFMFATFRGVNGRGTAVLVSDAPLGPFRPYSEGAVTPSGWEALDGTLFIDRDGGRWLVFCHEWQQINDGSICIRRLSEDLRQGVGDSEVLFSASQAPWTKPIKEQCYVADGPFLHRSKQGSLLMLWASFGPFGYAQGVAISATGELIGPWHHCDPPLWESDGGHGMLFETFDRELQLILHHPNQTPYERPLLLAIEEDAQGLRLQSSSSPFQIVTRRFQRGGSRRQKLLFLLQLARRRLGLSSPKPTHPGGSKP